MVVELGDKSLILLILRDAGQSLELYISQRLIHLAFKLLVLHVVCIRQ